MNECQFLIGHQTPEAKNLGLSLARLSGDMRVESIQTLAGPFGMDFCENSGEKPFEASQDIPKLLGIVNGCSGRQPAKDRPKGAARNFFCSRRHRASGLCCYRFQSSSQVSTGIGQTSPVFGLACSRFFSSVWLPTRRE